MTKSKSFRPKVSVVVITSPGYEMFLAKTLASLRKQQVSHEVILEDNPHRTLATACNRAIDRAEGEYIVRVDSDDWVANSLLSTEAKYLDLNPDIDCVWCDYWKSFDNHTEYMAQPLLEHACGAMFRKSVWENLGGYDESLHYQEAFEFWQHFHAEGLKAVRIEQPLYYYRQHATSMSRNVKEKMKTRQMILERYRGKRGHIKQIGLA